MRSLWKDTKALRISKFHKSESQEECIRVRFGLVTKLGDKEEDFSRVVDAGISKKQTELLKYGPWSPEDSASQNEIN